MIEKYLKNNCCVACPKCKEVIGRITQLTDNVRILEKIEEIRGKAVEKED